MPARRVTAAAVAFVALASALVYLYVSGSSRITYPIFPFSSVSDVACEHIDSSVNDATTASQQKHVIPNTVHYVWLLKNATEFRLSFKVFVSVYSAHLFFKPDKIYIHTDARPEVLRDAEASGDVWTKRVLSLPGITPNFIQAPNVTERGVRIVHMEHKADFLRMAALRDFGGVYLDTDVVPLRDVAPLRNSGFANVLGGATVLTIKHAGYLNNGVMMAVPQSTLMKIYYHAAQEFFDGRWETASIHLLTDLANRLLPLPSEVLLLEPRAFAPMSWEFQDQKRLFKPSLKTLVNQEAAAGSGPEEATCRDALAWLRQREVAGTDAQELDFSSSYVLHAFDDSIGKIRGWDHVVDLKYVLARQSNYARAVFPAVWHAVQAGIISEGETG
ncbi:hypothetical protein CONLIGDRAFT_632274 [Coniochaeta ligniaria NRRL 30616]|uniref:Glycosyl transferase n=1 Tax=Coniochaeta ligniaria NRRL 30616 TaxID=1408157 RepID=A0A1J7JA88_9PEZI|nr:hypothetical protein CONLIGDRAFT_632274 [Coniochaeta ligniaria NRRL 30616]